MLNQIIRKATGALLAAGGALALAGCLLTPGKFTSELTLEKGGHFAFVYDGEITTMGLKQLAQMKEAEGGTFVPVCYDEETGEERDCTDAEADEQFTAWQAGQESEKREQEQFMQMFAAFDPSDPEMAEKLVEKLRKMKGWDEVSYAGDGIYDVRFTASGMMTHAFQFPVIEDLPSMVYFFTVTPRADGSVQVAAPVFGEKSGGMGQSMGMMMAMQSMQEGEEGQPRIALPEGSFSIRTNGEILTNNTEDGPVMDGKMRVLEWTIDPTTKVAPTALIRL